MMEPFELHLYRRRGVWLFDDRAHGMSGESLVFGMEKIIQRFATERGFDERGFLLAISNTRTAHSEGPYGALLREEADGGGYWYRSEVYELRGWMGNAGLLAYFEHAPEVIYYDARPLPETPP
jgi:hypothetical protein